VKITLTGFRAHLWKALYWFRAGDHVMLKCRAVYGLPGTPATILELVDEARRKRLEGSGRKNHPDRSPFSRN
jgi:hypothetical protein